MSLKNVHYQRLETEDSDGEEDEAPPTHVELHNSHYVKGREFLNTTTSKYTFPCGYQASKEGCTTCCSLLYDFNVYI